MSTNKTSFVNKTYIIVVLNLTFILPAICSIAEMMINKTIFSFYLFGKWFIFSAVGLRLFVAGIKQTTDPSFTVQSYLSIETIKIKM